MQILDLWVWLQIFCTYSVHALVFQRSVMLLVLLILLSVKKEEKYHSLTLFIITVHKDHAVNMQFKINGPKGLLKLILPKLDLYVL